MIAYFDTASLVPLLLDEPSSASCLRVWNQSSRVYSSRLVYPEARAALARARRAGRINRRQSASSIEDLDSMLTEIDQIDLTSSLAQTAGNLADEHGLRGYDAVHLASAATMVAAGVVLVTGDVALADAGRAAGLAVATPGR